MRFRFAALLASLAVSVLAACGEDGSFRVIWTFSDQSAGSSMAFECGRHGVDSIAVQWGQLTPVDGGGAVGTLDEAIAVPCSPNVFSQQVGAGSYDFRIFGLGPNGRPLVPNGSRLWAAVFDVEVKGGQSVDVPVQLRPALQCADGLDNDADGTVDSEDPDCATACQDPAQDRHEDGTCSS